MRGKVAIIEKSDKVFRITPAYAGKRTPQNPKNPVRRDHPRLCGEKNEMDNAPCRRKGSPPPMRGKVGDLVGVPDLSQDHPRLCGEKCPPVADMWKRSGSPPPMRGKVFSHFIFLRFFRITPAYAGKSSTRSSPSCRIADHPRLCGEKTKKIPKQRYFFHQPASFSFSLQYT